MYNIALISHTGMIAGAERMLLNMGIILKKTKEYNPILFIPASENTYLENAADEFQIEVIKTDNYEQYIFISQENFADKSAKMVKGINEYRDYFIKNEVDLIINNTATSIVPLMAGKQLHIPVIGWIHGILDSFLLGNSYDSQTRYLFDNLYTQLSDKVLCCSEWTERYYKNESNKSKVSVFSNWTIETSSKEKEIDVNMPFICLNSFEEFKGIFVLLDAIGILKNKGCDFKVEMYGSGSQEIHEKMNIRIEELEIRDFVTINSRTNDVKRIYENSLALIQPSYIESFGMTIIEAMSYNLPVISTRSGGPDSIIEDGINGFLIERDNPQELAERMKFIIDNPNIACKISLNAKKRYLEEFSESKATERIKKIFSDVLQVAEQNHEINLLTDIFYKMLLFKSKNKDSINQSVLLNEMQHHHISEKMKTDFETKLSFSRSINKSKEYLININCDTLNYIGLVFGTEGQSPCGEVFLRIYIKGILIREDQKLISEIRFGEVTEFYFSELKGLNRNLMTVELTIVYNSTEKIGVYENRNKRSILYKLGNRFGFNSRTLDVLYYEAGVKINE